MTVEFEALRTLLNVAVAHGEYDGTYSSTGKSGVGEGSSPQLVCIENVDGDIDDLMGSVDGTVKISVR